MNIEVGKKVYIVVSPGQTELFLTRQDAREWSQGVGGIVLEKSLSPWSRNKISNIIEDIQNL
jgi:hypothetical protein